MAAASSKSLIVKLDRRGEHRDDVPDTPLSRPEGKFVFVPTVLSSPATNRGRNDDNDIYYQEPAAPALTFARGKGKSTGVDLPSSLQVVPTLKHTFRFLSTSNNIGSVTVGTLLAAAGTIGTTVIQTTNWNASVRLHSIKVWPPAGSSCFVEWVTTGGYARDEIKDSSLPTGVTVTKSLTFTPPKLSFAALWQANVGNTLFKMYAPTGSIIDVHVSLNNVGSFATNNNVVASAVLGSIYYLYLDGSSTHYFQPVALPTTI
jgi:hypothetical protein